MSTALEAGLRPARGSAADAGLILVEPGERPGGGFVLGGEDTEQDVLGAETHASTVG